MNEPAQRDDRIASWMLQHCMYGTKRGNTAILDADNAIAANLAEARKPIPQNFWGTFAVAENRQELARTRSLLTFSYLTSPDSKPYAPSSRPYWLVQYCLYGPQRRQIHIMTLDEAVNINLAEYRRLVPRHFWVAIAIATSEAGAKLQRAEIRKRL